MSDADGKVRRGTALRGSLAGNDPSSSADRAPRRAALIRAGVGAELLVLHAVDDDQPRRLVEAERREASAILREQVAALGQASAHPILPLIEEGDSFETVLRTAGTWEAELIVLGEHRRRPLRHIFAGTTVGRVMRHGCRPVLMVNRAPAGPYRHVLAAPDLSEHAARALRAAARLGLLDQARLTLLHVFEPPGLGALALADVPAAAVSAHKADSVREAAAALAGFVAALGCPAGPSSASWRGLLQRWSKRRWSIPAPTFWSSAPPAPGSCAVRSSAASPPRCWPPCAATRSPCRPMRRDPTRRPESWRN
jgi:universal stress protein E